jgi:hypothetical protein
MTRTWSHDTGDALAPRVEPECPCAAAETVTVSVLAVNTVTRTYTEIMIHASQSLSECSLQASDSDLPGSATGAGPRPGGPPHGLAVTPPPRRQAGRPQPRQYSRDDAVTARHGASLTHWAGPPPP